MTVNFTVNGKPAAVDVPPPTAVAKLVSRSSHAKGLRRRACAYLSEIVTQIQLEHFPLMLIHNLRVARN